MPAELRTIGVVVLLACLAPTVCVAWPNFCWMPAVALLALALGLALPTTPGFNALGALVAGALATASAVGNASCGALVLVALPLAMSSLRLGLRGAIWGLAAGVLTLVAVHPHPFEMSVYAGGAVDFVALTLVVGWLMWNAGLGVKAFTEQRRLHAAVAQRGGRLREAGLCTSSRQLLDVAGVVLAVGALPFVLQSDLVTVTLYIGFISWNHERLATFGTLVETLQEAAQERGRRASAAGRPTGGESC